jgi:hypothetical protein
METVDHPKHYASHPSRIEVINIAELLGFSLGNCFKYLARAKHKGCEEEDLRKALWYAERCKMFISEAVLDEGSAMPPSGAEMAGADLLSAWIDAEPYPAWRNAYRWIFALARAEVVDDTVVDGLVVAIHALRERAP